MDDEVVCRFRGNNTVMAKEKMDYMDVLRQLLNSQFDQ
jgi:DNA-directed RNA polymerase subunit beta